MTECQHCRDLVERSLSGQPFAGRVASKLWSHLSDCDDCQTLYDRLAWVTRAAATGGEDLDTPSDWELDLFQNRILDTVAPQRKPKNAKALSAKSAVAKTMQAALSTSLLCNPSSTATK